MSWRAWRPAIWLAMFGIAALILVNPLVGVLLLGGALGVGARIARRGRLAPLDSQRNDGRL